MLTRGHRNGLSSLAVGNRQQHQESTCQYHRHSWLKEGCLRRCNVSEAFRHFSTMFRNWIRPPQTGAPEGHTYGPYGKISLPFGSGVAQGLSQTWGF